MPYGVRVWRFRTDDGSRWVNISSQGVKSNLDTADVATGMQSIGPDHWVFERTRGQPVPTNITSANILSIVADTEIPVDATVWCWIRDACRRVYRRRSSPPRDEHDVPLHIQASVIDCEDGDMLVDCGEGKPPIHIHHSQLQPVEVESTEGEVNLDELAPDTTSEAVFVGLVQFVHGRHDVITREIRAAAQAVQYNDVSALNAAAEALLESFTGATPGPTQGTNVVHQLNAAIDDVSKIVIAVQDHSKADSTASGVQGDFGSGVAGVDSSWQAVASVLSAAVDVFKISKLAIKYSGVSTEQKVDLGKLLIGQHASLGSNVVKSYSTVTGAVNSISTLATGASILSIQVAVSIPAVGAVAALAGMVRASWQAEKSRKRASRLRSIMKYSSGQLSQRSQALLYFGMKKAMRKHKFKAGEAVVAAGSVSAGTCLAVGAALAAANAWNPVGWGLGALCVVGGAGLLTYKIVRKVKSNKRAKKRGFTTKQFPTMLVMEYLNCWRQDVNSIDSLALGGVLEAYGVEPSWLQMNLPQEQEAAVAKVQAAIFRIERHLK